MNKRIDLILKLRATALEAILDIEAKLFNDVAIKFIKDSK